MISLKIEDSKKFMRELFVNDMFDRFLCCQVVIRQKVDYTIDGHYNIDFFDSDEQTEKKETIYASWTEIKPLALKMISGHQLPLGFKIIFCASGESIESLLKHCQNNMSRNQVEGLFVNLIYKEQELTVTTGSSYHTFTLDKSLDFMFEDAVKKLIRKHDIVFSE